MLIIRLLEVRFLNLDSTSMKQLREAGGNSDDRVRARILEIVNTERGKMHNPVTNSGGVLLGVVREIGSAVKREGWKIGTSVVPLASLSCLPLRLGRLGEIHGDRVEV